MIRQCFFCQRHLQRLIVYTLKGEPIWGCRTCSKNGRTRDFFVNLKKGKSDGTSTTTQDGFDVARDLHEAGE